MTRISRKPVRESVTQELDDQFAYLISSLSTSHDIRSFFLEFLTQEEKVMLTKRLMLHLLIAKNYHTLDICQILTVTKETVRVHKKLWEKAGLDYQAIIIKLGKRRSAKQFWQNVEKVLQPLNQFLQAKSNMKARSKVFTADYD